MITKRMTSPLTYVKLCAAGGSLLLMAGLAACSTSSGSTPAAVASDAQGLLAAAQKEGTFTIYSALPIDNVNKILKAFETKYPGIKGEGVFLSTAADDARMQSEYKTHDTFDISINNWGADTVDVASKGIFASYTSPSTKAYDSEFQGTDAQWLNIWAGTQVIAYNTKLMTADAAPHAWTDLLDARYSGKVGVSTPLIKGGAYWWYYSMDTWHGDSFITQFAANKPVIESAPSGVGSALAAGQIPVGVVTAVSLRNQVAKGAPLAAVYPTDGIFLQTLYMAIDSRAPHPNAARLFYDWLASPDGEQVAANIFGYYSTLPDGPAPDGAPALSSMNVKATDTADFAAKEDTITDMAAKALGVN